MKPTSSNLLKLSLSIFALAFGTLVHAQKLEDVQLASLYAATPVKVDGKPDANFAFQASNKNTKLTYTLSNDDKNLYLVIQSNDKLTNQKIMMGGINLSVNTSNKKKDKEAPTVTYPLIVRGARGAQGAGGGGGRGQGGGGGQGGQNFQQMTQIQRDSMQAAQRKTQLAAVKEIKVLRFKDITDSIISIYNEYGVKAAASFDDKDVFTYELSIPLAVLDISLDKPKEFMYQVKVNGMSFNNNNGGGDNNRGGGGGGQGGGGGGGFGGGGGGFGGGGGGFGGGGGGFGGGNRGGVGQDDRQALQAPTDFWGKYVPAKKQ